MRYNSKYTTTQYIKVLCVLLAVLFGILYYYRKPIKEHKVTKAKMEMFKRMLKTEPEEWGKEFNDVLDSMILNPSDSIKVKTD